MATGNEALTQFKNSVNSYGQPIRIKYYTNSYAGAGSWFDDDTTLSQSGTDYWTSGLVQPIRTKFGSTEARLVEQGKLLTEDKKVYFYGDVSLSGERVKIGIGSPNITDFFINEAGVEPSPEVNGTNIYNKAYVRYLTNGSFDGE